MRIDEVLHKLSGGGGSEHISKHVIPFPSRLAGNDNYKRCEASAKLNNPYTDVPRSKKGTAVSGDPLCVATV